MLTLDRPVICIVGPTASGKSDVAQHLAWELSGEIVSADSMQVYRGMDIGTGKVLPEKRLVIHHGIDLVDPGQAYSAALFQSYARTCFAEIDKRKKCCILAGGTGLYIRAAIDDYDFPQGNQVNNPIRDYYTNRAKEIGTQAIWEELNAIDPESARVIHPHNVRRVVRAFEMLEAGESYARQKKRLATLGQYVPAVFVGLSVDADILNARINARVDSMVEQGLVREVEGLLSRGFRDAITAPQAIGYKEIVAALDGDSTMEEAIENIKQATRRYAKRQRTWFRKDKRIVWIDADDGLENVCERALGILS